MSLDAARLCFLWRKAVSVIPSDTDGWGVPEDALRLAGVYEYNAHFEEDRTEVDECSEGSDAETDIGDEDFYAQLETMTLKEEYENKEEVIPDIIHAYSTDDHHSRSESPSKRRRPA